jgi:hypothetical protein
MHGGLRASISIRPLVHLHCNLGQESFMITVMIEKEDEEQLILRER